jgi:hypothetical protein
MGKIDPIVGGGAGGSEVSDQRLGARPGIWPWRLQPDLSKNLSGY